MIAVFEAVCRPDEGPIVLVSTAMPPNRDWYVAEYKEPPERIIQPF